MQKSAPTQKTIGDQAFQVVKMRMFYFVLAFIFLSTVQAKNLTWNEAVNLAQQNSLELQAAISNLRAADHSELSKISPFLPRLSASASSTHSGAPGTASANSYSASLTLSQNIFAGFADINTYSQKKSHYELQKPR